MKVASGPPVSAVSAGLAFPSSAWSRECTACGACCAAPDISSLGKPLGVPCAFLRGDCLCAVYDERPGVCRAYAPDWVCGEVAPLPDLAARVARFLEIYGLAPGANAGGAL